MEHLSEILPKAVSHFADCNALLEPSGLTWTYRQLAERSDRLRSILEAHALTSGDRIGLVLPKRADTVAAILAILAMKAAYIPIDAQAPMSRNAYILQDSQVKAVFLDPSLTASFLSATTQKWTIVASEEALFDLLVRTSAPAEPATFPADLAYMLYTSGSTGLPKGVLITHRNALAFVAWSATCFAITEKDVLTSIAPFHFDLSIFDLFVGLSSGACLVLIDQKGAKNPLLLSSLIATHKVSVLYATPTLLKLILHYGKPSRYDHSSLRIVLFAGEVFALDALKQLKALWTQPTFYNLYGPTETNVVTWQKVPDSLDQLSEAIPIGGPCPFALCRLWGLEGFLPEVPGQKGELIVSGESVAQGYLNLPEKTREAFLHIDGKIWYKTGDVVAINANGAYVFIGRKDRMVKRRGYRIELAEVERALLQHPDIHEAAVLAVQDAKGDIRLQAYIHGKENSSEMTFLAMKMYCNSNLPKYMLPDSFIFVASLPKTSSHKVDYQQLKKRSNA